MHFVNEFFCSEIDTEIIEYCCILIYRCMQNHNDDTIKTSGHSSLEKYTSHFIERVVCERELETEQRLQRIDPPPHSSGYHSLSFLFSWAAHPGALKPCLSWDMVLIPASSLQLIWTSCRHGYITIFRPPTSCERHNFALNSTPRQSRSPLLSWYLRPDAPVIYTGAFLLLTAWPGSICNNIRVLENICKYINKLRIKKAYLNNKQKLS